MAYSPQDRQRINLRAKRKLGKVKDSDEDKEEFMEQCISDLEDNGVDDAESACESLWEEQGSDEGD